jgi:hypothetical protein
MGNRMSLLELHAQINSLKHRLKNLLYLGPVSGDILFGQLVNSPINTKIM